MAHTTYILLASHSICLSFTAPIPPTKSAIFQKQWFKQIAIEKKQRKSIINIFNYAFIMLKKSVPKMFVLEKKI